MPRSGPIGILQNWNDRPGRFNEAGAIMPRSGLAVDRLTNRHASLLQ